MISLALIKKWKKMLNNDSVFHVSQVEGRFYAVDELGGYYNDLCDKVRLTSTLNEQGIPFNYATRAGENKQIYFPITIFQYGLGAYDLWLETGEQTYREKFFAAADWAINNQKSTGAWDAFGCLEYSCKVSSMAQGEGISLLARAYKESEDTQYLQNCIKATEFMILPKEQGGTAKFTEKGLELWEYPDKALVLNGWIFSAFGLLDCWKISGQEKYLDLWGKALDGIRAEIKNFDSGHWSFYDLNKKYTSPFYHKLHIELLKALNRLNPDPIWDKYIKRWSDEMNSKWWSKIAFVIKAKQKLTEKKSCEWVVTG